MSNVDWLINGMVLLFVGWGLWGARRSSLSGLPETNPGGRAEKEGVTAADFPAAVIRRGQKVEMEHTRDPALAMRIALDHLAEHPRYYEALTKMERKLEREKR